MGPEKYALTRSLFGASVISLILFGPLNPTGRLCFSQEETIIPSGRLAISKSQQSLQMIVSTSQYLTFPQPIPVATVQNDAAIQVQPTGRNEILVSAISTGVAQLDVKGEDGTVYNVQVVVTGDARELQAVLSQESRPPHFKCVRSNKQLLFRAKLRLTRMLSRRSPSPSSTTLP
ncbi:MAG: pilus assembly protein N-terminal domain-containing protein [Planctomycetota bacterium]|nr:pilus assembly protein N-terminal domain-containing protein [Planctomycetota bacterium]